MPKALFINGVFKSTLDDIIKMQHSDPTKDGYLQPYSSRRIKLLAKTQPPTPEHPITLYLSLTDSLHCVSYIAKIVEWRDKTAIYPAEQEHLNKLLKENQPSEMDGIYQEVNGKECLNLIVVRNLKKVNPFPVWKLTKTSNETALKAKQTSGGWSVVHELTELPDSN